MPALSQSTSHCRAPFPMREPPRQRRAVSKPPFIKPILFGPPTRAARKHREAQLVLARARHREKITTHLRQAQLHIAHVRHGKKLVTLVPQASNARAHTPPPPPPPSPRAAPVEQTLHLPAPPIRAAAAAAADIAIDPAENVPGARAARVPRQKALDAISAIARAEAELEAAESPSKWCTKNQMALIRDFIGDYRTAGNATQRRALAHRFYDIWFLTFPPLLHVVEKGLLPLSVLRPTHVLTRAQLLIVAGEQEVIRKKILEVFKHEYEKWEALDWYEHMSEDGDENDSEDE